MEKDDKKLLVILGPTATGKTRLAATVAAELDGEIISADSRQVYRGMDLGTGKDYEDYIVDGKQVPFHLIDIVDAGYRYSVYEYQRDFLVAYYNVVSRDKIPILCGGTGMYLDAVLRGYRLIEVPFNNDLRDKLKSKSLEELVAILSKLKPLHNVTDSKDTERVVRAIEIEEYYREHDKEVHDFPDLFPEVTGIMLPREVIRQRITERLRKRLESGMIAEVEKLIGAGVDPEDLAYYGLEYRFLTDYVTGSLNYNDMYQKLNSAIHAFAKRQMTWFRRMEKNGMKIHWIDGLQSPDQMKEEVLSVYHSRK